MQKEFNPNALTSIRIINSCGYQAYLVGGGVRDFFLNVSSTDYDIVTNASLEKICEIFKDYKNTIYANRQCVGVKINDTRIEISPFKGNRIEEDLANRDFSINSIAYHPDMGFIDPYNGIDDIKNKIIKTIKNSDYVIKVDPIRILRAIRFSALYDLEIDNDLFNSMMLNKELLLDSHPMRIPHEINPIFLSKKPSVYLIKYKEIFKVLFPKLKECDGFNQCSKWHSYDVFNHIMKVIDSTKPDLVLRLSAFFHDICKPECFKPDESGEGHFPNHYNLSAEYAKEMLEYYSYNKLLIKRIYHLVLHHETRLKLDDDIILSFLVVFNLDDIDLFFNIQRADIMGQNPALLGRLKDYDKIEERINYFIKNIKIIQYKDLQISMKDLEALGYKQSTAKRKLVKIAVEATKGNIINDRKSLLEDIKKGLV